MSLLLGFVLDNDVQKLFAEPIPTDLDCLLHEWFTPSEWAKHNRLPASRHAYRIMGHVAVKKSLTMLLDISPYEMTIEHYPSGAPFACVRGEIYPVSVSHLPELGAALVSLQADRYLGVDLVYGGNQDVTDLMLRVSTLREKDWLFAGETRSRFFDLWALKEAALKTWGVGMRVAPWDVEVTCPIQAQGVTTIKCLTTNLPELCGMVIDDAASYIVGVSWLEKAGASQSIMQAYQQPRGLHMGC